ncbi:PIG-L deacetylase family protein [Virgibacillus sp. L01]|uniref:PIG-L deacetylase family protein n=1 Tax=Virgibacillus sp. L01 TaxID=3457429 RepID=UPI003FCFE8D7
MIKKIVINVLKPILYPITSIVLNNHYKSNIKLSEVSDDKSVIILAPHMDDETIGLGGTIKKHSKSGARVHCVFITDGSSSVSEMDKSNLSNIRKQEMEQVKSILGINQIHYMDLQDGHAKSDEYSQQLLKDIILEVRPDVIYSTPFVDAHKDHMATGKILSDTLKTLDMDFTIRLYEVNCPVPKENINFAVDITDEYDDKIRAIQAFKSQVIAFDGFIYLNKVKKNLVQNNQVEAVENFLEIDSSRYVEKYDAIWPLQNNFHTSFKQVNRKVTLLWAIFKNIKFKKKIYNDF